MAPCVHRWSAADPRHVCAGVRHELVNETDRDAVPDGVVAFLSRAPGRAERPHA